MAGAARSSDQLFTVLSCANSRRCARLGLAISRRAARRAVDRNRIKRLAREAFRQSPHCAGVDIIVFAKQAAATQSRAALRRSLDRHYRRVMNHGASE
jgi:ribonuclease P protein component